MSMQNKDWLCHILASITIVLWASSYVLTPYALQSYSPTALSLLRYMFGAAALVIFGCIKRIGLPKLRDVPKFFLAGALGITVYMVAYNIGAQTLSGTTCSVVLAMNPVFTAILSHFLFREKIRFLGWVSIAIGFGGILILTLWNGALSINIGILWVLASAMLFSGYNITQRQYSKDYTPLSTAIYSIVAGAIMLFVFLPELLPQLQAAPMEHTMIAAYLGLVPTAVGFVLWTLALSMASKTTIVSNYMFATPLVSMVLNLLIAGTWPDTSTYVGGAVIILSLILFSVFNKKAQPLPQVVSVKEKK